MQYPQHITKLIESFSKLPGIGNKTAERLAFHVISSMKEDDATTFAKALIVNVNYSNARFVVISPIQILV